MSNWEKRSVTAQNILVDKLPHDYANPVTGRLIFIDGMRGIAALWVMLFHYYYAIGGGDPLHLPQSMRWFFEIGDQGVFIFFVLSGFVISKSVKWGKVTVSYFGRFILRRSLRLDPPYWVVIIVTGLSVSLLGKFGLSGGDAPVLKDYLINCFYLDNITGNSSIVAVGWTLQYEIQFYLVFILLVWVLVASKLTPRSAFFPFFMTGVISAFYSFSWFPAKVPGLFLNYWMYFLLGVFTEWVTSEKIPLKQYFLFVVVVLFHGVIFNAFSSFVAVGTALLLFVAGRLNGFHHWLNYKPMIFFGAVSYSLYLLHPFFGSRLIRYLTGEIHPVGFTVWVIYIGTIISTMALVYVFYLLIEKPAHVISRKIRLN